MPHTMVYEERLRRLHQFRSKQHNIPLLSERCDLGLRQRSVSRRGGLRVERLHPRIVGRHSDREWECGHIEGAQHIMLRELAKNVASLLRNRAVITVCGSGYRSSIAASLLEQCGLGQVSSMDGGMSAWHRQQLPTGY